MAFRSPDLNLIVHRWDVVEQEMKRSRDESAAEKSVAITVCNHVSMEKNLKGIFPSLVESMPSRTAAVLA